MLQKVFQRMKLLTPPQSARGRVKPQTQMCVTQMELEDGLGEHGADE